MSKIKKKKKGKEDFTWYLESIFYQLKLSRCNVISLGKNHKRIFVVKRKKEETTKWKPFKRHVGVGGLKNKDKIF